VSICCATLLLSQLVGPACEQTRSSNPRGRAYGPSGKGSGEEGILSGDVPVYLYCPAFNVSVSLGQCYFSYDFLVIVIVIVIHFLSF